tara:strand:- start:2813 stop:3469 length:657 start_codon:yes stop_codon:yes gene_type:complete
MKILFNESPFFNISLENVFSTEELRIVLKEINSLKQNFKDPRFTESASNQYEILKNNTGLFLSNTKNYESLKTTKIIDKCIKKISINKNWKNNTFKRLFNSLEWGSELVNCYKNNDYYKPHVDSGIFSLIFFLWDDTSSFKGGDLYFPEHDYLYKCNNNCGILFFSKELHGVTPIVVNDEKTSRYSIVVFTTNSTEQNISNKRNVSECVSDSNFISYQ